MLLIPVVLAVVARPARSPGPLQTITHVRSTPACTALRENVGLAIQGILVNDKIVDQGRLMLYKVRRDAIAAPLGIGWSGGAGPASSLDDVQMYDLVGVLAGNLKKIETLLSSPRMNEPALRKIKARLERVAEQQEIALNILSANVFSNESTDLQSRKGVAPDSESAGPVRVSMAEELVAQQSATAASEQHAARAVKPLIDACR